MLRNPAYQGTACFQKTIQAERQRGGIATRPVCSRPRPRDEWIEISVPALITPTQFALAQERLDQNCRFAARHTKQPSLAQGLLICQLCGYTLYRWSSRSTRRKLIYYRCTGADAYRFPEGRRCANRPVRQDVVDALVWGQVIQQLANPALVRDEIDRRLAELRASHPVDVKRDIATKELVRTRAGITRLIEAYQEQLISLDELRTRMPPLRQREAAVQAQLAALEAELLEAETYIALAESFEGFLAKLHDAAQSLGVADRQRVLRLVVKEVQVGPDSILIKHSIPLPDHHPNPRYLLSTWHDDRPIRAFTLCRNAQFVDGGQARGYFTRFFRWCHHEHRHTALQMLTPFQVHSGQGPRLLAERAEVRQRTLAARLAADRRAEPRDSLLRLTAEGLGASRNASEVGGLLGIPPKPVLEPPAGDRRGVAESILIHQLTSDRQLVQFTTPSGHFAGN